MRLQEACGSGAIPSGAGRGVKRAPLHLLPTSLDRLLCHTLPCFVLCFALSLSYSYVRLAFLVVIFFFFYISQSLLKVSWRDCFFLYSSSFTCGLFLWTRRRFSSEDFFLPSSVYAHEWALLGRLVCWKNRQQMDARE